jgi:hypothetical protein
MYSRVLMSSLATTKNSMMETDKVNAAKQQPMARARPGASAQRTPRQPSPALMLEMHWWQNIHSE